MNEPKTTINVTERNKSRIRHVSIESNPNQPRNPNQTDISPVKKNAKQKPIDPANFNKDLQSVQNRQV